MIKCEKNGQQWLEFELLHGQKEVVHGFFLRDLDLKQSEGHKAIQKALNLSEMVYSHLVHGDKVEILPHNNLGKCDGMMTKEVGLGLLVTHADCQVAIFYDPLQKVIANVHCGWRGNVLNIYEKTVNKMVQSFQCHPENIIVCISPSLGPEHSEFINYKTELPASFMKYQVKSLHFDLWQLAEEQLQDTGILPEHIEIARLCTFEDPQLFFSHRRDKKTGRHGTVVALKN